MMQDTSKNTYPYLFEAHKMFTAIYLKSWIKLESQVHPSLSSYVD